MRQKLMGRLHKLIVYATYPLTSEPSCTIFSIYAVCSLTSTPSICVSIKLTI